MPFASELFVDQGFVRVRLIGVATAEKPVSLEVTRQPAVGVYDDDAVEEREIGVVVRIDGDRPDAFLGPDRNDVREMIDIRPVLRQIAVRLVRVQQHIRRFHGTRVPRQRAVRSARAGGSRHHDTSGDPEKDTKHDQGPPVPT
jgi:hypothetical protein